MTRLIPPLTAIAVFAAVVAAQPHDPDPKPGADAWGEVRVTPERTPAVEFALAPGNREVAFYGYQHAIYFYDIAAGKVRLKVPCDDDVKSLSYSPDGKQLVTAEWTAGLKLRDGRTGEVAATLKPAEGLGVAATRFLPDGKVAAFCWRGGGSQNLESQLALWDVAKRELLRRRTTQWPEGNGELTRPGFASGTKLITRQTRSSSGYVTEVSAWLTDPLTNARSFPIRLSMDDYVLDASPDGSMLLVFNANRPPRLIHVPSGACIRFLLGGHRGYVTCGAFSPDGKLIATASGTQFQTNVLTRYWPPQGTANQIVIWEVATGKRVATLTEPVPKAGFTRVAFSPDGKLVVAAAGESDQPGGEEMRGGKLVLWGKFPEVVAGVNGAGHFKDAGDHVEDLRSGLLWQKDGGASGRVNYYDAIRYATKLKLGERAGWRLPTPAELAGIYPATDTPFTDTKYDPVRPQTGERADYWTAATDPAKPDAAMVYPWCPGGKPTSTSASETLSFTRCVHDPIKK